MESRLIFGVKADMYQLYIRGSPSRVLIQGLNNEDIRLLWIRLQTQKPLEGNVHLAGCEECCVNLAVEQR